MYNTHEHVALDHLLMEVLGKVPDSPIAKSFDAGNAATKFRKKLLSTESLLAPIAKLLHEQTMDAIEDHHQFPAFKDALTTCPILRTTGSSKLKAQNGKQLLKPRVARAPPPLARYRKVAARLVAPAVTVVTASRMPSPYRCGPRAPKSPATRRTPCPSATAVNTV